MPDLQSLGSGLALGCGVVAILRRKRAIGGWLFYFFCQVFLGLILLTASTHWKYYFPDQWSDPLRYFLFTLSSLSRMTIFAAIAGISVLSIATRDAPWIVVLRYTLGIYLLSTLLKVAVDLFCFPGATSRDTLSLGFPLVWMAYFSISERVRKVFIEKSWL
ncbi:MAG: hypothetical protein WDO73_14400 [Ignavibacteriota bacterium]